MTTPQLRKAKHSPSLPDTEQPGFTPSPTQFSCRAYQRQACCRKKMFRCKGSPALLFLQHQKYFCLVVLLLSSSLSFPVSCIKVQLPHPPCSYFLECRLQPVQGRFLFGSHSSRSWPWVRICSVCKTKRLIQKHFGNHKVVSNFLQNILRIENIAWRAMLPPPGSLQKQASDRNDGNSSFEEPNPDLLEVECSDPPKRSGEED